MATHSSILGQGSLVHCSPCGCKEQDMTERLGTLYPTVWIYDNLFAPSTVDGTLLFPKFDCQEECNHEQGCTCCISSFCFSVGKEPACQCRRHRRHKFDPWVGKMPWKRKWQPSLVFLPRESHRQKSLAGSSPWCLKEPNITQWLNPHHTFLSIPFSFLLFYFFLLEFL